MLSALRTRPLRAPEFDHILALDFPRHQIDHYLGALEDIVRAVRRGPAHQLHAVEEGGALIGFFAVHPDGRDASRWWLGWFGLDRAHQGGGRGRVVLAGIVGLLRRIPGCREIGLLVAPDNAAARRLYAAAGFRGAGLRRATGELILRLVLTPGRPTSDAPARAPHAKARAILRAVVEARTCRMGVPVAAQLHGEVAFPP